MTKLEFKKYRMDLILHHLDKPRTANEVIDRIFCNDLKKGNTFIISGRGWKFYVHLNKFFSPMEKEGKIQCIGNKDREKLWISPSKAKNA